MENMIQFKTGNQLTITGFPGKEKPAPITQQDRLRFVANNLDKMPELKRILEKVKHDKNQFFSK